jgi:hypothetical protein
LTQSPALLGDALADGLSIGVCLIDHSWRVRLWNAMLERWTGRPRRDLLGADLFAEFPHLADGRYRRRLDSVLRGGPPAVFSPQLHPPFFPCRQGDPATPLQRVTVTLIRLPGPSLSISVEDDADRQKQVDLVSRLRKEALAEIEQRKAVQAERERLIAELTDALGKVRVLRGLIPICAACKQVRTDGGYWQSVESYVSRHTGVDFSHGLCPACEKKALAELESDTR